MSIVGGPVWQIGDRAFDCSERTLVMGILNVTPDSFSDGGAFVSERAAIDHGVDMVVQGADIIDVGGESTRPGSDLVTAREEIRRVAPIGAPLRSPAPAGPI